MEKFKSLVEQIDALTVIELSELVKVLEERYGVSSAAPMMMAAAPAGGAAPAAAEEKSSFNVELSSVGDNKINVIKAIREVTQLGLAEAKAIADSAPKMIKEGVDKATADAIKAKIEEAGGKVTLK
jgi:large subunit ribosomal protein L7/L12